MKKIELNFNGCWLSKKNNSIPSQSGIYCVYRCTYDKNTETVNLIKLIYIGEGKKVWDRLEDHEKYKEFIEQLQKDEKLCFSVAIVDSKDRERAEAALIFHHKPILNKQNKDNFNYEDTQIITSGKNCFLDSNFTVETIN